MSRSDPKNVSFNLSTQQIQKKKIKKYKEYNIDFLSALKELPKVLKKKVKKYYYLHGIAPKNNIRSEMRRG